MVSTYKYRHLKIFTTSFASSTIDTMSGFSNLEVQSSHSYKPSTFKEFNHNSNYFTFKKYIIFKYLKTICIKIFEIQYLFHLSQNFFFLLYRFCSDTETKIHPNLTYGVKVGRLNYLSFKKLLQNSIVY